MSCTTRDNLLILLEIVLISSNHLYALIKYRSESKDREPELENFLNLMLSEQNEVGFEDIISR